MLGQVCFSNIRTEVATTSSRAVSRSKSATGPSLHSNLWGTQTDRGPAAWQISALSARNEVSLHNWICTRTKIWSRCLSVCIFVYIYAKFPSCTSWKKYDRIKLPIMVLVSTAFQLCILGVCLILRHKCRPSSPTCSSIKWQSSMNRNRAELGPSSNPRRYFVSALSHGDLGLCSNMLNYKRNFCGCADNLS